MLFLKRKTKETPLRHEKMQVDQDIFTPSVFTIAGGMRSEGRAFYSRVPILMLLKNEIRISKVTSWIQSKANFALLRTMFICLRGLRQKLINEKLDTELEHLSIKNKLIKII